MNESVCYSMYFIVNQIHDNYCFKTPLAVRTDCRSIFGRKKCWSTRNCVDVNWHKNLLLRMRCQPQGLAIMICKSFSEVGCPFSPIAKTFKPRQRNLCLPKVLRSTLQRFLSFGLRICWPDRCSQRTFHWWWFCHPQTSSLLPMNWNFDGVCRHPE